MRANHLEQNERLARYIERAWPNRFLELCAALRRYPLPVTSGAAATALSGGGSIDAARAVDAYCRRHVVYDPQRGHTQVETSDSEVNLVLPPQQRQAIELVGGNSGQTVVMLSPFRCFKLRRVEGGASLLSTEEGRAAGARGGLYNKDTGGDCHDGDDVLFSLLDSSLQIGGEIISNCTPSSVKHRGTVDVSFEKLSVKELRERCASRGLLTSGTKAVLLARLHQYHALQQSSASLPELTHCSERGEQRAGGLPAATTSPRRFAPTHEDRLGHLHRLRTPFISPSASRQQSPALTNALRQEQSCRPIATPQEFVALAMQQKKGANCVNDTVGFSVAKDKTDCLRWRILVDNRERIHGTHDRMIDAFTAAGVPAVSCLLPCGDFMIGVDMPDGFYGDDKGWSNGQTGEGSTSDVHTVSDTGAGGSPAQCVFSAVVERKTVKDLCASIATSRYHEQRQLLGLLPVKSVVWVVEGTTELLRPDEQRRVLSACASLASMPRFCVVRTRNLKETILWLHHFGAAYADALVKRGERGRHPLLANTTEYMKLVTRVRQELHARTTFPRMLMCIRGCSSALAMQLASKYGSLLQLWKHLREFGRDVCDADADICKLSKAQKDVYVKLTEFLLMEDYS